MIYTLYRMVKQNERFIYSYIMPGKDGRKYIKMLALFCLRDEANGDYFFLFDILHDEKVFHL